MAVCCVRAAAVRIGAETSFQSGHAQSLPALLASQPSAADPPLRAIARRAPTERRAQPGHGLKRAREASDPAVARVRRRQSASHPKMSCPFACKQSPAPATAPVRAEALDDPVLGVGLDMERLVLVGRIVDEPEDVPVFEVQSDPRAVRHGSPCDVCPTSCISRDVTSGTVPRRPAFRALVNQRSMHSHADSRAEAEANHVRTERDAVEVAANEHGGLEVLRNPIRGMDAIEQRTRFRFRLPAIAGPGLSRLPRSRSGHLRHGHEDALAGTGVDSVVSFGDAF